MKSNNILRLLLIGVLVVQPWFWQAIQVNFLLSIILVVIGLLLTYKKKWTTILLIIITSGLLFWQIESDFDQSLFRINSDDISRLNEMRSAFPTTNGQFFVNKPIFILQNIERNFSYNLDPNLYFFANHPRERAGIVEQSRLWAILLPFFLLGIYYSIRSKQKWIFLYIFLGFIMETFINLGSSLGPILLFAPFSLLISIGLYNSVLSTVNLKK